MFENYNKFVAEVKEAYNQAKMLDGEFEKMAGMTKIKPISPEHITRDKQKNEDVADQ